MSAPTTRDAIKAALDGMPDTLCHSSDTVADAIMVALRGHTKTALIAREIYVAVETLTGDPNLLSILGSYGDTLPDADILALLLDHNAGRPILAETH